MAIHTAAQALMDTFVDFPGATTVKREGLGHSFRGCSRKARGVSSCFVVGLCSDYCIATWTQRRAVSTWRYNNLSRSPRRNVKIRHGLTATASDKMAQPPPFLRRRCLFVAPTRRLFPPPRAPRQRPTGPLRRPQQCPSEPPRGGQKKTRRGDSSGSSPWLKNKAMKKEPDDLEDVSALKTPRRVTPSLVDVSSSDKLHLLSRSEPATDRALPLSSATAHARQDRIDEIAAAADNACIKAVQRHCTTIDLRMVWTVSPPSPLGRQPPKRVGHNS